jgi:hypothetical protein
MPEHVVFRTKPQLVIDMLTEELAAGTPFRYLCADSGYGRDPHLRPFCHEQEISYVMAVPVDLPLVAVRGGAEPGRARAGPHPGPRAERDLGAPLVRDRHQRACASTTGPRCPPPWPGRHPRPDTCTPC